MHTRRAAAAGLPHKRGDAAALWTPCPGAAREACIRRANGRPLGAPERWRSRTGTQPQDGASPGRLQPLVARFRPQPLNGLRGHPSVLAATSPRTAVPDRPVPIAPEMRSAKSMAYAVEAVPNSLAMVAAFSEK